MASIKFPKTLIPFTIGTGPGSIPEVTKELVGWHYNDLEDYAQTWSDLAEGFITNIKNTVNSISDINTTIPVPDWNGDIPIDLIGLIGEMPENPITASDYLIKIPDELLWEL